MRLIPSQYWEDYQKKTGEGLVFDLLRQVNMSNGCTALHSLNLSGDHRQRWFELDFLIISEAAIYGLEVKAGRVSCSAGIWYVHNPDGSVRYKKHKSPLVQASAALDRFRTGFMAERFANKYAKIPYVKVAVLCSNHRPDDPGLGPEMPNEFVIYKEDLHPNGFKERLNAATREHNSQRSYRDNLKLSPADIDDIASAIRPEVDKSYPSRAALTYIQDQQKSLTEEQYHIADAMENVSRYMMDGGAGTGKTFLLAYDIHRRNFGTDSVGVLTSSAGLAEHIGNLVHEKVVCFTPEEADRYIDKFDWLYVDEAQDFVNESGFSLIDRLLVGGLQDGNWRFFGDFENQRGANAVWQEEVFELLESSTPINKKITLTRNVRNTTEIVQWLEGVCRARVGQTTVAGSGLEVTVISQHDGDAMLRGEHVNAAIGPIHREDLTVLYPLQCSESISKRIQHLSNRFKVRAIDDFRGLESPLVYIIGLERLEDQSLLRDQAYKGVSRATNACFIEGEDEVNLRLLDLKFSGR